MAGIASDSKSYLGVHACESSNVRPIALGEWRLATNAAWDTLLHNPERKNEQYSPQKMRLWCVD
jgi:hypothetical protein